MNYPDKDGFGNTLNTEDYYSVFYSDRIDVCKFIEFKNGYAQVKIILVHIPGHAKPSCVCKYDSLRANKLFKIPDDCLDELKGQLNEGNLQVPNPSKRKT